MTSMASIREPDDSQVIYELYPTNIGDYSSNYSGNWYENDRDVMNDRFDAHVSVYHNQVVNRRYATRISPDQTRLNNVADSLEILGHCFVSDFQHG